MQFTLPRLFIATAILAAALGLARLIDSVPVALMIGCPLAGVALIVKRSDVGGIVQTAVCCFIGAVLAACAPT